MQSKNSTNPQKKKGKKKEQRRNTKSTGKQGLKMTTIHIYQ